jgi:hypothetical protein
VAALEAAECGDEQTVGGARRRAAISSRNLAASSKRPARKVRFMPFFKKKMGFFVKGKRSEGHEAIAHESETWEESIFFLWELFDPPKSFVSTAL